VAPVDIVELQMDQLASPHTVGCEHEEHGVVASSDRCRAIDSGQDRPDVLAVDAAREPFELEGRDDRYRGD
jgi:hypothetical protein